MPLYRRVLVKLSGEALCAPGGFGVDTQAVQGIVKELEPVVHSGVQVALVLGGGNFFRGKDLHKEGLLDRATADGMGMLATVMNGLALQKALENQGIEARVLSAIATVGLCEPYIRRRAIHHLEKGRLVILSGGTGSPFFTTDTGAALRASEIQAEVLFKATKVDGVFDSDPIRNPSAKKFDRLTYGEVLARQLGVMDLAAVSLCMESKIPVIVFRMSQPGNLAAAVAGKTVGTIISAEDPPA